MKYNDNGQWKDINIKVSDTLPVGSVVEYDGTEVPDGYEKVTGIEKITPTLSQVTGNYSCYVKNGICCFSMGLRSLSGTLEAYTVIATGLPKSLTGISFNAVNGSGSCIRMQITTNGEVSIANPMTTASNYLGTATYIVDEN